MNEQTVINTLYGKEELKKVIDAAILEESENIVSVKNSIENLIDALPQNSDGKYMYSKADIIKLVDTIDTTDQEVIKVKEQIKKVINALPEGSTIPQERKKWYKSWKTYFIAALIIVIILMGNSYSQTSNELDKLQQKNEQQEKSISKLKEEINNVSSISKDNSLNLDEVKGQVSQAVEQGKEAIQSIDAQSDEIKGILEQIKLTLEGIWNSIINFFS